MLETHLLRQFAALAEYGTLSEAARKLHLSQPALSRSMRKLEDAIGVALFQRTKNHIAMNETGKLAAEYAKRIIQEEQEMVEKLRAFDRSLHTMSIGCCAPMPLNALLALLPQHFPGMSFASELATDEPLLKGLKNGFFNLIVLHHQPKEKDLYAKKCGTERLFLSVPHNHPLAASHGIYLRELDGQHILLYAKLGFWHELCLAKMPHAKFLMQHERHTFEELVNVSALPSFTTDVFIRQGYIPQSRVAVPILDQEADVTYYCVCQQEAMHQLGDFFASLPAGGIDWSLFNHTM